MVRGGSRGVGCPFGRLCSRVTLGGTPSEFFEDFTLGLVVASVLCRLCRAVVRVALYRSPASSGST